MVKKRKPGGGRKPKGPIRAKSEVFTTRITPETREAIEREAQLSGQSISQAAERLLESGLASKRRGQAHRPLRSLCFVIEQLARAIADQWWTDIGSHKTPRKSAESRQDEWLTDPFCYAAFTAAVNGLLEELRPKGMIESPLSDELIDASLAGQTNPALLPFIKHTYQSPGNLAAYVFAHIVGQLKHPVPSPDDFKTYVSPGGLVGDRIVENFYGFAEAHRDLKLASKARRMESEGSYS
jgi:hypothetical protein